MYTYENPTAMNEIARLCGCKVVFFPEGAVTEYSKEELEEKYEPGMHGITFAYDKKLKIVNREKEVPLDVKKFRKHYKGLIKTFDKKLDKFIKRTQRGA